MNTTPDDSALPEPLGLASAREWQKLAQEGEALLGRRGWGLFRSFGRMMSGPHSGSYVSALAPCEVRELLRRLQLGERVEVHLMHRHRSGNYEASSLSVDGEGRLVMHYADQSQLAE